MSGKGVKRKLEQEEEDGVMKRSAPEEESSTRYWLQRQNLLQLSLLKLHSRPEHSDTGLARRVLITNTLRHISVSAPPPPPDLRHGFSAAPAEIEASCPAVGGATLVSMEKTHLDADTHPSETDSAHSLFSHTPSLLTDFPLDDFLFSELDGFLFDNDVFGPSLNASMGTSGVVSMVTDDLVKTLAVYGDGGLSQSALPSAQAFKLDLNELDHVMEVLVGL